MYAHFKRVNNAVQLVLDMLCLKLIWLSCIHVRVSLNPFLDAHVTAAESNFWAPPLILVLPLCLATSLRFRLYRTPEKVSFWTIQASALENALILTMVTAVVTFFSREFGELVSRMFVPVLLPVAFVFLSLSRYAAVALAPLIQQRWENPLRVALIGDWEKGSQYIGRMHAAQARSFRGLIVPEEDLAKAQGCAIPVLGTTRQLAELINKERLDHVVVLNASLSTAEHEHCSRVFKQMDVPVSCALDFAGSLTHVDVSTNFGIPFIELTPFRFTRRQEIVKRLFDGSVAALSLLLLLPVLFVITILIKATSKGPVLHKSLRIGKGGRQFTFLKFRSMYVNSDRKVVATGNEKTGHIFKMKNDPRVTSVGRFLRRYSLDELPQLVNILRGEMSFVGPRPLPACDLGLDGMSKQYSAWSEARARVHPGLTGLWQVSGRSDLSFEDMVRLDLSYIQRWSLALDIRILLDTPMLVLRGAGAY